MQFLILKKNKINNDFNNFFLYINVNKTKVIFYDSVFVLNIFSTKNQYSMFILNDDEIYSKYK